ncbi:MAG: RNA methyltransferase [Chitinophagales bacterium]|nr:RNA methyltransferase [Chitinophagales bacterium]
MLKNLFLLENDKHLLEIFADVPHTLVNSSELKKMSGLKTPNNCLAEFSFTPQEATEIVTTDWIIVLDEIQDPGNLGTIIRIADWFGISQIVCSENCADVYNQKVVQATMASIARVKICYIDLIDFLSTTTLPIFVADMQGVNYTTIDFPKKGILLIGNEGNGVKVNLVDLAQHIITIPKIGQAESLNAAIATSLICAKIRL